MFCEGRRDCRIQQGFSFQSARRVGRRDRLLHGGHPPCTGLGGCQPQPGHRVWAGRQVRSGDQGSLGGHPLGSQLRVGLPKSRRCVPKTGRPGQSQRRLREGEEVATDRLRSPVPAAVDAIERELTEGANPYAAAVQVLKVARIDKLDASTDQPKLRRS